LKRLCETPFAGRFFVSPSNLLPALEKPATQWLLHYHLATPHGPTAFWHHLVRKRFLPGNTFSADDLLHHLSGVDREEIKHELRDLATQRVIQFDLVNKISSLWPASTRPQEVEEVIQKAVDRTVVDQDLMEMITKRLSSLGISSLNFGHASDWSPQQVALTAEMFTAAELRKLLPPYRSGVNGIEEGPRGLVIWLVAQTEEEKLLLRQNAQSILNDALGDVASPLADMRQLPLDALPILNGALEDAASPLPVVMILPKRAASGLVSSARRLKALESLTVSEREKIGTVIYQQEQGLAQVNFKNSLDDLVDDLGLYSDVQHPLVEYAVPSPYRASVQALRDLSLKAVVTECYRQAYAYRVEFYSQYAVGGKGPNQLRTATQKVAIWLFGDTAGSSVPNLGKKDIQYLMCNFHD
jgi:hypothetical protein